MTIPIRQALYKRAALPVVEGRLQTFRRQPHATFSPIMITCTTSQLQQRAPLHLHTMATTKLKLPTIRLDTTLTDLYRAAASPRNAHKRIAQVLCGTNSGLDLSDHFPRNSKYLYQDSPFNTVATELDTGDEARHELAVKYLSLIPQRDAFISGSCPVVLFNLDESAAQAAHDRREADRTLAVLEEGQIPELVFCKGPESIPVKEKGIDLIAYKLMVDGLDKYPLIVRPDTHWLLNSKAALAGSGLPTPACQSLELDGHGIENHLCCDTCRGGVDEFIIPEDCTGPRARWFEAESGKIFKAVEKRKLPFVLKNQQTFGGAGTYIVTTEDERRQVIDELRDGVLRRLLSSVTAANSHLKPGTILLSDLVADPIADYGITFFVTDKESGREPVFLAVSEQMTDGPAWIGSTIDYGRQPELQEKFGDLTRLVAKWLQKQGYVGPAGMDVLETKPTQAQNGGHKPNGETTNGHHHSGTNGINGKTTTKSEFPNLHIVDLNVRTSGSLCLPLLRGHFTGRGLNNASSFSISVRKTRDEFVAEFAPEFEAGSMCIVSWYEDRDAEGVCSVADIAVGAPDDKALGDAIGRVREASDGVTF